MAAGDHFFTGTPSPRYSLPLPFSDPDPDSRRFVRFVVAKKSFGTFFVLVLSEGSERCS